MSEYAIFCFHIHKGIDVNRNVAAGDLSIFQNGERKRVEVKCVSSRGPISFGSQEHWDVLFILLIEEKGVTIYKLSIPDNHVEWKNVKVSRRLEQLTL